MVFKRELLVCENQIVIGREGGTAFLSQSTEELLLYHCVIVSITLILRFFLSCNLLFR